MWDMHNSRGFLQSDTRLLLSILFFHPMKKNFHVKIVVKKISCQNPDIRLLAETLSQKGQLFVQSHLSKIIENLSNVNDFVFL